MEEFTWFSLETLDDDVVNVGLAVILEPFVLIHLAIRAAMIDLFGE
jgi:hypothetical protein